jgi:hypothetical protein
VPSSAACLAKARRSSCDGSSTPLIVGHAPRSDNLAPHAAFHALFAINGDACIPWAKDGLPPCQSQKLPKALDTG